MKKAILILGIVTMATVLFTSCAVRHKSHCNTKGKTRVEMGWM